MKKLWCFLCLALLLSCSHKNDIRLRGELENGNGRELYLSIVAADGLHELSSAKVVHNSFQFDIKPEEVADYLGEGEPGFFQLSFSPENGFTTLAQRGQTVYFTADANNLVGSYRVQGPQDALLMWELDSALASFATYTDTLLEIYQYYRDNDTVRSELERRYVGAVDLHQQYLRRFISKHPSSFSSIIAFYQRYDYRHFFDEEEDADVLQMITDSLEVKYPNSQYVKFLRTRLK